jgi:NADPH:quinone reductase-like Zn-dependent oxidoreductase
MKSLIFNGANEVPLVSVGEMPKPQAQSGEALIRISHGALNHRDFLIATGQYLADKPRSIMGSDGSGTLIESLGKCNSSIGENVIINPVLHWGNAERVPERATIRTLGLPDNGTLAEFIAVPIENIQSAPPHLSLAEAAALPLAGLTAYRALFSRGDLRPNDTVVISGIGGGVSLLALQLAVAYGAQVFVTSRTQRNLDSAMQLGAAGGVLTGKGEWSKSLKAMTQGADLIIDSIGGEHLGVMLMIAREGGRIITLGAVTGNVPDFSIPVIFYKQLDIRGTSVGSPRDFEQLLKFVNLHKIHPVISKIFPLAKANEALDFLIGERAGGKVVIEMPIQK